MGISGVYALASGFYKKGTLEEAGAQIDLVLDRSDHVINLFEMKFYNEIFQIGKSEAQQLREKMSIFRISTQTRKQLFWTLLTTFGIKQSPYRLDVIDTVLEMDVLFEHV